MLPSINLNHKNITVCYNKNYVENRFHFLIENTTYNMLPMHLECRV